MKTLSDAMRSQLKENVGMALQRYLQVSPEKRQEMEKQGVNISNFIFDAVYPVVMNIKTKSILIIMEEGIGNMVMLTPALKMLRHLNPRLEITVWGKSPAIEVIKGWDVIDNIITDFDNKFYDLVFYTIWSKNIKAKYGQVLSQLCKGQFESTLALHHESLQHHTIVEFFDGWAEMVAPHCQIEKIPLPDYKYVVFGDTILRGFGWEAKRWTHYEDLARKIQKKLPDHKIILIGDHIDKVEFSQKTWTDNVTLDYCGKLSIPQLAYLLQNAEFYVGNDTGPTHIAAAVGTKTYAIFGPTRVAKNRPMGNDVTIINHRVPCSPCQYTEKWSTCDCLNDLTSAVVYNKIFFPDNNAEKDKVLLVGYFAPGALRNENYIKNTLKRDFGFKVIPVDYRTLLSKSNPVETSFQILNEVLQHEPKYVLICGGQGISAENLSHINSLCPNTQIFNWYVDNRRKVEEWFYTLSSVCHRSFWSTGDPQLLSQVFSQTQRPCEFLPIVPDDKVYFPIEEEKTIDVLFVGTPHSKDRIDLLEYLVDNNINIQIYGNEVKQGLGGKWTDKLKPYVKPGIFDAEFNYTLNKSKIVLNQNIVNDVPLYFSDRYFYPMATKTVGLNMYIPQLEEMFEDGKHMVFWKTHEECLEKINELLQDKDKRKLIQEEGYKLYKERYTLKHILGQMFE